MKHLIYILILLIFTAIPLSSQDSQVPTDTTDVIPGPEFNLYWVGAQLIPSPQWFKPPDSGVRIGMRWQVTPLLYSFGHNRYVSSCRFFMLEPVARQNGSVELFLSPEYLNLDTEDKWMWRGGARVYFPLVDKGDNLSWSGSISYYQLGSQQGISYEAGVYIFFGIVGLQITHSPELREAPWLFTLRLRFF